MAVISPLLKRLTVALAVSQETLTVVLVVLVVLVVVQLLPPVEQHHGVQLKKN